MDLTPQLTILPYRNGSAAFANQVRSICQSNSFQSIAIDIPEVFQEKLGAAVADLPFISALIAQDSNDIAYYLPIDPCDAVIEAVRQSMQLRIPCVCIGPQKLDKPITLPALPDEYSIKDIGFDGYVSLALRIVDALGPQKGSAAFEACDNAGQYIAFQLHHLKLSQSGRICAFVHLRHIAAVVRHYRLEQTHNLSFPKSPQYSVSCEFVNPDHLYFALGELPFITGKIEAARYDALAPEVDLVDSVKSLFTETRDEYHGKNEIVDLSPSRIQAGLTFLRNLTLGDSCFSPSLPDIVTAAKGVGGNSFALSILKSARYYPYLPYEHAVSLVSIGIDRMHIPGQSESVACVNLFRDSDIVWRTLSIRPDPSALAKQNYRYQWKNGSACSHLPEDQRIESFNTHVRKKAEMLVCEDRSRTEKFCVSVKDGIDIRETMRNWFTGDLYVRELPPFSGAVDMVVIVFDDGNDALYPHCATWYAEHAEESTLTFYATDPFSDMIGPGIARCTYGGVALLFPPRPIPSVFEMPHPVEVESLADILAYNGLLFSKEKIIPYVCAHKPSLRMRQLAIKFKKRFLWIPLSSFGQETLRRLRRFHVLNGKTVRSWASRYIGEY